MGVRESFPGRASEGRGPAVGMGLSYLRPGKGVRGSRAERVRTERWEMMWERWSRPDQVRPT